MDQVCSCCSKRPTNFTHLLFTSTTKLSMLGIVIHIDVNAELYPFFFILLLSSSYANPLKFISYTAPEYTDNGLSLTTQSCNWVGHLKHSYRCMYLATSPLTSFFPSSANSLVSNPSSKIFFTVREGKNVL